MYKESIISNNVDSLKSSLTFWSKKAGKREQCRLIFDAGMRSMQVSGFVATLLELQISKRRESLIFKCRSLSYIYEIK